MHTDRTPFVRALARCLLVMGALLAGCETAPPAAPVAPQILGRLQPAPRITVEVDIRPHTQWTPARIEKARAAARLLESVINSDAFARALTSRTGLQRSEGMSGADILRVLRSGVTLAALRRGESVSAPRITLALAISPASGEFSYSDGFTDLGTGIIYAQREWMDRENVCRLAGLYAHEYMHVTGFTHTDYPHPLRGRTVPYAIGYMVTELAAAEAGAQCKRAWSW